MSSQRPKSTAPGKSIGAKFTDRDPRNNAVDRPPPGPWVLLAAWGPCGFSRIAPGTVGTLGAIPLSCVLAHLGWFIYVPSTLLLLWIAVIAARHAGQYWGVTDASPIVIDEVVGYLVTMAFVPWSWKTALLGFALFRLFDVTKPWPASSFDKMKTGLGVVMDDVAAGLWALASIQIIIHFFPGLIA